MNTFLRILADIALLPVSGSILLGNRERLGDWSCPEAHPQANNITEATKKMSRVSKREDELNSFNGAAATPFFLRVKRKP
jgi:hypothetical protein